MWEPTWEGSTLEFMCRAVRVTVVVKMAVCRTRCLGLDDSGGLWAAAAALCSLPVSSAMMPPAMGTQRTWLLGRGRMLYNLSTP